MNSYSVKSLEGFEKLFFKYAWAPNIKPLFSWTVKAAKQPNRLLPNRRMSCYHLPQRFPRLKACGTSNSWVRVLPMRIIKILKFENFAVLHFCSRGWRSSEIFIIKFFCLLFVVAGFGREYNSSPKIFFWWCGFGWQNLSRLIERFGVRGSKLVQMCQLASAVVLHTWTQLAWGL